MVFFFNDTATTEIYTLSLHDALPIFSGVEQQVLTNDLLRDLQTSLTAMNMGQLSGWIEIGRAHV